MWKYSPGGKLNLMKSEYYEKMNIGVYQVYVSLVGEFISNVRIVDLRLTKSICVRPQ